jgi:CRP-like cAMP-binding protein
LPADERRHGEEICASRARARISPDQQKEVQKMHEALNETLHELWESPEKLSTATALAESIALDVALTPVSEEVAHTILRKVRALRHLSADELLAVLHASSRRLLPRYTHAMREGAACECCFVVLAGSLEIYRSQPERDELNRQMKASIQPDGRIVEVLTSGVGSVAGVALVSEVLGEEGLVLPSASRERSLITLEPVELLVISPAAIAHLRRPAFCSRYRIQGVATVTKLLRGVESLYIERALRRVPFFTTLPRLTQEHISSLFVVRCVAQGERCVEQGEPASAVFVLLAGCIERWRRLARPTRASGGAKAHLVGEIVEGSSSPWFSQVRMAHVGTRMAT